MDSFFEYTFYQSSFDAESTQIPKISGLLEVSPLSVEELRFNVRPVKTGQFQDLPAKIVYRNANGESRTTWSAVRGKMKIVASRVRKVQEKKKPSVDPRWIVFSSWTVLNIAVPFFKYRRLLK